jgi:hypothetical protein
LRSLALPLALLAAAPRVSAQAAQKYSFHVSALGTSFEGSSGSAIGGVGIEPQLRFNRLYSSESFGTLTVGVGGQFTRHASGGQNISISGAFLEPRWLPNTSSEKLFPYVAGRLAVLNQSNNFGSSSGGTAFGAGAGVAFLWSKRVNLDAGVVLVRQKFGDFQFSNGQAGAFNAFNTYAAKIGASFGFPARARQAP